MKRLLLPIMLLLALFAASCGDDDDASTTTTAGGSGSTTTAGDNGDDALEELIAAAQEEGSLTFYSAVDEAVGQRVADAFSEKYDIDVEHLRLSTTPLIERFTAELQAGGVVADVLFANNPAFFNDANAQGWTASLTEDDIPELANWPATWWNEDSSYATLTIAPVGITYRTSDLSEDDVAEWEDLLNPDFEGEILFANPTAIALFQQWCLLMERTYGPEFLEAFGEQVILVDSIIPGTQQLAAGEGLIVAPGLTAVTKPLIDQGAPLAETFPTPTVANEVTMAIVEDAPNPNAARLFMSWLMTEEGQVAMNEGVASSPLGNDVPGTLPLDPDYEPLGTINPADRDRILGLVGVK